MTGAAGGLLRREEGGKMATRQSGRFASATCPPLPGGGQVQLALISVFRVPNDEVLRPARALFAICSDPPLTPHFTGKAAVINLVTLC
jgi:hypothetical protein